MCWVLTYRCVWSLGLNKKFNYEPLKVERALARKLSCWSIIPYSKKVVGWILDQGTYVGFWFDPWQYAYKRQQVSGLFIFFFLSL